MLLQEIFKKTTMLSFKDQVAVKVVNHLNDRFKEYNSTNRAFLVNKNQVEVDTPAGIDVEIVDGALEKFNGVYGDGWFEAPPSRE